MNNWRLLLLAVVVVVQPIGSFTESNLIDGRDCCKHSEDVRLYGHRKADERRSLDFKTDDRLTANEERRLRSLNGIREEQRYETIRSPMLTRSETLDRTERRISPELSRFMNHRLTREQQRSDENRNRDVSRNILGQNERDSRESKNRNIMDATRLLVRVSRDTSRDARFVEHESGNTMSRLPIRINRSIEERRLLAARDPTILKREQEGIARNSKLNTPARFDSRRQLDDNRERRIFNRRNQEEINDFRQTPVVRVELRRRDTGLRDRISSIRSKSENSAGKLRQSRNENTRLTRAGMDIKYNKRIDEPKMQRDENRRAMNTEERRLDRMQERLSRTLDTTRNDERSEQQPLSMDRTSRASEDNTRYVRAARIRTVKVENLDTPNQERANHRISKDRTTQSRRTVSRITKSTVSQRQQRNTVVRMNARESGSQERRQVSRLSRDTTISALREIRNTERVQESRQTVQSSKDKNSILRAVRDKTEQELREGIWESSELRPRDNNRLSNNIVSVLRADREFPGSTEQARESRKEINFRKLDSTTLQNARDHERSNLRRKTLQRSMERARITRSISAERGIDARGTTRNSRSIENSKLHENTRTIDGDHKPTRDQDGSIEKRMIRKMVTPQRLVDHRSSRTESFRVERAVRHREVEERDDHDRRQRIIRSEERVSRNVDQQPQRREFRRSSRSDSNRLERFVRSRTEFKENLRREMQHKERDGGRTRIILNRRSTERVSAESRLNWESSKDYRKVPITRNRDEARNEDTLTERRQENREIARDFRTAGEARITEIRSERVLSESKPEKHDSRNVRGEIRMDDRLDSRLQRDATRFFRDRSLQRQSRDATERLNKRSRIVIALTDQNEREVKNNERQIRFDRSLEAGNAHRESSSDIRENKYLSTERMESHLNDGRREELSFRNIDAGTFQDSLVQDADELVSNWQIVFYTLQAVYLCGLLIQMLTENANKSKKRTFYWWSTPKNLIKVD